MVNRLFDSFPANKQDDHLTKNQESSIIHDIEIINFKRMKLLLILLLIIEILFIVFVDIPNLRNFDINRTWSDKRYFTLHLLLLILASSGIIIAKIFISNDIGELKKGYRIFTPAITMIMLVLISMINGLDQIKIGASSSVFIANLLMCCAIILIRFPVSLIVYIVPFLFFIGGLVVFQKNTAILNSSIINGSIFFIAVNIISKFIYDGQFNLMTKNILLEDANQKLNYLSSHDPLTGLSNRRNFEIHVKQKMRSINQYKDKASLVLIDVDHFKNINDKFGHPIGDIILKELSNILLENIKDTDLAARWGGEEFVILLPKTSIDEASILADKIRTAIEKKVITIDDFQIKITASFGVSQLKGNFSTSFDSSFKLADKALYEAKSRGRNCVVIASYIEEE